MTPDGALVVDSRRRHAGQPGRDISSAGLVGRALAGHQIIAVSPRAKSRQHFQLGQMLRQGLETGTIGAFQPVPTGGLTAAAARMSAASDASLVLEPHGRTNGLWDMFDVRSERFLVAVSDAAALISTLQASGFEAIRVGYVLAAVGEGPAATPRAGDALGSVPV